MNTVAAPDLLAVWEKARSSLAVQRPAVMLRYFGIDEPLSVGATESALLDIYEETFGSHLDGLASCPTCATEVELNISIAELRDAIPSANPVESLVAGGHVIDWRLPNNDDLAVAATCTDTEGAALLLLSRCVGQSDCNAAELQSSVREQLADRIAKADPWADISLDLACPECDTGWQCGVEIGEFVWAKLQSRAHHLLRDVDELARAYGWSEAQILALSQDRRDLYVELVRGG